MSVTFKQASKRNIERAIEKAKELKPHVKVNGFNDFTVTGSKGDAYSVKFSGKGVDFTAHCTCKGSERELVCYHAAAAAPVFKAQVQEKAAQAAPCANCHEACEEINGFCFSCLDAAIVDPAGCANCGDSEVEDDCDGLCFSCYQLREELRATEKARVREAEIDLFGYASAE